MPAAVGPPVSLPLEESASPDGSADYAVQLAVPVAPLAARVAAYATPVVAGARDEVVTTSPPFATETSIVLGSSAWPLLSTAQKDTTCVPFLFTTGRATLPLTTTSGPLSMR